MRKLLVMAALLALAGCKKAEKTSAEVPSQQQPQNQPQPQQNQPNVHAPTGVVTNTGGGGGSGGAAQAVRKAVGRAATQNDMAQLQRYISTMATDQMPTQQQVLAEMRRDAQNLAKLCDEGAIKLTKLPQRGVWAYTAEPVSSGGYHLAIGSQGAVEQVQPAALGQRLRDQGE